MEWIRGDIIGYGSFATVSLAKPVTSNSQLPPLMAVKSSDSLRSDLLNREKEVFDQLGHCPQIVKCFGDDTRIENGDKGYNLFLEYASRGSLKHLIKNTGGGLPESDVRRYTRSVLKGLSYIHERGFAHCDIKLENILIFDDFRAKIADFGLAKKTEQQQSDQGTEEVVRGAQIRGTPLYMAPESVNYNEYESPADIWALGCTVVEMVTGTPAWDFEEGSNFMNLLLRIGSENEYPIVPDEVSDEGKDFLSKCFDKDPRKRWTAKMLLSHSFMTVDHDHDDEEETFRMNCNGNDGNMISPKSPFDFLDWVLIQSTIQVPVTVISPIPVSDFVSSFWFTPPADRIEDLVTDQTMLDWSDTEEWVTVRCL